MTASNLSPEVDVASGRLWDVIVVGTGMGGASIGLQLARMKRQVLFCEMGAQPVLRGAYPEMAAGRLGRVLDTSDRSLLEGAGRCGDTFLDASALQQRTFIPFVGCGPGGSSALYGMALERFMRSDFESDEGWPIGYDELAPHYAAAETLFQVRGDLDPIAAATLGAAPPPALEEPPPLSAAGAELASYLAARGLHPYRLPTACEFVPGCAGCQGYLCPSECKNDAARICLQPALLDHGAKLLTSCRVVSLRAVQRRVTAVQCRMAGREIELRGRVVVLAAGAMQSPLILLRSEGDTGHAGLGNSSGLVGRRLMRHLIDLYLVRPARGVDEPFDNRRKELACNDFYAGPGGKLGTLQSFGRLPPPAMLYAALHDDILASNRRWAGAALALAKPLLMPLLRDRTERWSALATITEDLPDFENGIAAHVGDPTQATLRYAVKPGSLRRAERFRLHMDATLRGRAWRRLPQTHDNRRIAHVCGTCRFGDDPAESVLDRNNRAHDLDNLFIVDSSFFPSSGGTNPSLTVAANALRVGQHIAASLP